MAYATNLQRRNGTYYFRVRIPADLRQWFDRDEIKKSLRTKRLTHARGIHKLLDYRTERLFMLIRTGILTDAQIRKLKDEYIRETLEESDKARLQDGPQLIRDQETGTADTATPYSDFAEEGFKVLEGGNSKKIDSIMTEFLGKKGVSIDPSSLDYLKLRREIADAFITVMKVDEKRDLGDFSDPYYLETEPAQKKETSPAPFHLLSEAIRGYLEDARRSGACSESSLKEYEGICSRLVWFFGDRDIRSINREEVRWFRDSLSKLPAHLNKKAAYKGKSVEQLLKMDISQTIGDVQINKYISRLKSVFKWAEAEGWITDNPTLILKVIKSKTREDEQRKAYTKEDLERIINGLVQEGQKGELEDRPERFWVPLIGIFSGMRVGEICQLQTKDIAQEDGVWHFIAQEEGDKSIKTLAGNRKVPIHPALIELGLLRYVEKMKEKGAIQVWENLKSTSRGRKRTFTNWFNGTTSGHGFNRTYVTQDNRKTFHSLRHTFRNEMKQRLIDDRIADEIIGHKHGSLGLDRYGKPFPLPQRLEAMKIVHSELDLSPLKNYA